MDSNIQKAIDAVRKIVFEPRGIKEVAEPEDIEQEDFEGNLWEKVVHYISEEDHKRLFEEDFEGGELTKDLPEIEGFTLTYAPDFELDEGEDRLGKPAICFYAYSDILDEFKSEDDDDDHLMVRW